MAEQLAVYWGGEIAGYLTRQRRGRVRFQYAGQWLEKYHQAISFSLPCGLKEFGTEISTNFFENLLPESGIYEEICRKQRIEKEDIYSFLRSYGQDCAGALTIIDAAGPPPAETYGASNGYREVTGELKTLLAERHMTLLAGTGARLSIAGAQDKLPVRAMPGGTEETPLLFLPDIGSPAPTTDILKPQSSRFLDLHKNEAFCMALAQAIGLSVPESRIIHVGDHQAYLVARYDRVHTPDGAVKRLHQEDFCQAFGHSRGGKYEEHGGPGFTACGKLLLNPAVMELGLARDSFIRCAIFNYIIGNCDAHGKNFALLHQLGGGVSLAPFYDLVSTMAYPELDQKFAMAIGKTFRFDRIAEHPWRQFGADMNIHSARLSVTMRETAQAVQAQAEGIAASHEKKYSQSPIYPILLKVISNGIERIIQVADTLEIGTKPKTGKQPHH